jgi:hypothetical protein
MKNGENDLPGFQMSFQRSEIRFIDEKWGECFAWLPVE